MSEIELAADILSDHGLDLDDLLARAALGHNSQAVLAAALESIGASDLDSMIWSPFAWPPSESLDQPLDPFPFASLAAAILARLDAP